MTRNEKIAGVMGWEYFYESGPFSFHNGDQWFDLTSWEFVKLLQAKMVADKHMIKIMNNWDGKYMAESVLSCKNSIMSDWCDTEPAAIVDLFCKVYGITDEN